MSFVLFSLFCNELFHIASTTVQYCSTYSTRQSHSTDASTEPNTSTVKKTPLLLEIDQRVKNNRTYCAKGSAVRTVQYYGVRA